MTADLDRRLVALAEAAQVADGRLQQEAVDGARRAIDKAGARLGLGIEATVVALAGPTGAGKSLLFNALSGSEAAVVGRRRPTTSDAQAAVWSGEADQLLDWLEVKRRHRVAGDGLDGLVLLDLPDFDSVEDAHRLEVDRMVELADLLVWVVEPQKYADAALHDGYLRALTTHDEAMAVVLNQADLLSVSEASALRDDVARLLEEDGLRETPVLVVSARTGSGLQDLRSLLARRIATREAAVTRLSADVDAAARRLQQWCGDSGEAGVGKAERERLSSALAVAAGMPRVVAAVGEAHRHRGALATGWPPVRWLRRLKADPLRRLRLGDRDGGGEPGAGRTSLPPATDLERAQVATAVRVLGDEASTGLLAPWPTLVRSAATADEERIVDRLDQAVGTARLDTGAPRWWRAASLLQWLFAAAAAVGAAWIGVAAVAGCLGIDEIVPLPELRGVPIPTWLLLGGFFAGLVLAFLTRLLNRAGARRRQRAAERELRPRIESVADELVLAPIQRELDAHETLCRSLAVAAGTSGSRRRRDRR